jgi:hypothetical protein
MGIFRGILGTVLLIMTSCRSSETPRRRALSYSSDIGVAFVKSGKACLEIDNANVPPKSRVVLVLTGVPQSTSSAVVVGRAEDACATIDPGEAALSRYEIRTQEETQLAAAPAIAVLRSLTSWMQVGNLVAVDLDHNGRQAFFRSCESSEGIHFTVWSGRPLEGVRLWHQYFYLGYDITPNCTQKDVQFKE